MNYECISFDNVYPCDTIVTTVFPIFNVSFVYFASGKRLQFDLVILLLFIHVIEYLIYNIFIYKPLTHFSLYE